jgi:hypothetical protein
MRSRWVHGVADLDKNLLLCGIDPAGVDCWLHFSESHLVSGRFDGGHWQIGGPGVALSLVPNSEQLAANRCRRL